MTLAGNLPLKILWSFAKMCNRGVISHQNSLSTLFTLLYQPHVSQKIRAKLHFMHLCKYVQAWLVEETTNYGTGYHCNS